MPRSRREEQDKKIEEALTKASGEVERIDAVLRIRRGRGPEDDGEAYPIIQRYLQGDIALDEAIYLLTAPIDGQLRAGETEQVEDRAWDICVSVLESARRIPFRDAEGHSKLIALLQAYKSHYGPPGEGKSDYCYSLSGFGIEARELFNGPDGYSEPEMHAWTNLNYFLARLTGMGNSIMSFWIYCIWMMRAALEETHTDDHRRGITAAQKYNLDVPAAAVWVLALGKQLYDREEDLTPTRPNQGNPGKGGDLYKGKPEFSKARWAFWKKRFNEVSDMQDLSDETRAIAREAFEAMVRCEEA
jgi:hypothetical protein